MKVDGTTASINLDTFSTTINSAYEVNRRIRGLNG